MPKSLKYSARSQEMRTGNNMFNRRKRVVYMHPHDIDLFYYWGVTNYGRTPPYRGIPLDDQTIKKLGFAYYKLESDRNGTFVTYDLPGFRILHNRDRNLFYLSFFIKNDFLNHWIPLKEVLFVHQVQNLIFELSGTMINLKK